MRLSQSSVGRAEVEAVSRVLTEDGYLGMGKEVKAFEEELANFLGVPSDWVICVNSGTAALHLAVEAITNPGDEILVQSLTYVATFQAITAAGAVPIPCEVWPETITLDCDDAQRRLSSRTKAVMPVHYASYPGELDSIYRFARLHKLRVIEDAAHAFGSSYQKKKIGSFGDIICFSFDGIKNITSGEGGAVVTPDSTVAQRIRDARLLGVKRDTEMRFAGKRSWDFDVCCQGYRYHMSNLLAAIGRVQLHRFREEFAGKRIALARHYRKALSDIPGLNLLATNLDEIVPHIFPLRVLKGHRDALRAYLEDRNIEVGIHYKPNHLLSYFGSGVHLPVTEALYEELLSLPLHPGLEMSDVSHVSDCIKSFFTARIKK